MTRSMTNALYLAFVIAITLLLPVLLFIGTSGSLEGIIAAVLSFAVMASYIIYTFLLGNRN